MNLRFFYLCFSIEFLVGLIDAEADQHAVETECDESNANVEPYRDSSGKRSGEEYQCKHEGADNECNQSGEPYF